MQFWETSVLLLCFYLSTLFLSLEEEKTGEANILDISIYVYAEGKIKFKMRGNNWFRRRLLSNIWITSRIYMLTADVYAKKTMK